MPHCSHSASSGSLKHFTAEMPFPQASVLVINDTLLVSNVGCFGWCLFLALILFDFRTAAEERFSAAGVKAGISHQKIHLELIDRRQFTQHLLSALANRMINPHLVVQHKGLCTGMELRKCRSKEQVYRGKLNIPFAFWPFWDILAPWYLQGPCHRHHLHQILVVDDPPGCRTKHCTVICHSPILKMSECP